MARRANGLLAPTEDHDDWLAVGTLTDHQSETYRPVAWSSADPSTGSWEMHELPLGTEELGTALHVTSASGVRAAGGTVGRGEDARVAVWIDAGAGWASVEVLPQVDDVATSLHDVSTDGSSLLVHTTSQRSPNPQQRTVIWKASIHPGDDGKRMWEPVLEVGDGELRHWVTSVRHVGGQFMMTGWESDDDELWPVLWTSPTGDDWETVTLPSGGLLTVWATDVAWFNGEFIVVGAERLSGGPRTPLLWRSASGEKWLRRKPRVSSDFERLTTTGFAFERLVVSGDALYATTDDSFLSGVFRTESANTWEQLPQIVERSRSDQLSEPVPAPGGLALLQDGEVARFSDEEWTRIGGDLVGERDLYSLGAMASDGADVLIAGRRSTVDSVFPRLWTRRDGLWEVLSLGGGGWISDVGAVPDGWLMVGAETTPDANSHFRLWQSPDLQTWQGRTLWADETKSEARGLVVADGVPIAAVTHTSLNDRNQIWTSPGLVRVGADITTADFGGANYSGVDTAGWYRKYAYAHCALDDSALFFHETGADDPDDTRSSRRPAVVHPDLTVELGDPLRVSRGDNIPEARECVGFAGRYWLVGSEVPEGDRRGGRLWWSGDGLSWEAVEVPSSDVAVSTFDDVVAVGNGLLIVGRTDEQLPRTVMAHVEIDPDTGKVTAFELVEPDIDIGSADPHEFSIANLVVAGDEVLAHGTVHGYNRVWSASVNGVISPHGP